MRTYGLGGLLDVFSNDPVFNEGSSVMRPKVNISETDEGFTVELAVPGFEKDSFNLELDDKILKISAEVKNEKTEDGPKYTRKEFSMKSFERIFTLPDTISADKIGADYTNGILSVTLPKKEEAKSLEPRKIEIS